MDDIKDAFIKAYEESKKNRTPMVPPPPAVCPSCGYCQHCGRGQSPWHNPWYNPWNTTTVTCGGR